MVAPKQIVFRPWPCMVHASTTSPTISIPRSAAAESVHSPPEVAAPVMSARTPDTIRIGTSTPCSTRSFIVAALTRFVNIRPRPFEKGVADRPTTVALVSVMCAVHADSWVWASSTMIRSVSCQPLEAMVWADAIWNGRLGL